MRGLPQTPELEAVARNTVWFKPPGKAISNPAHFVAHVLTYGTHKFYGPTEYRVVRLHTNSPPSSQCKFPMNHIPQGVCWVVVNDWQPLPNAG